jgi:hypothetical protein
MLSVERASGVSPWRATAWQSAEHFDSTFRPAVVAGFRIVLAIIGVIAIGIGMSDVI